MAEPANQKKKWSQLQTVPAKRASREKKNILHAIDMITKGEEGIIKMKGKEQKTRNLIQVWST